MRKWLSILLALLATQAGATSLTRDYSDLWFVPTESGWGANVIQQREILFLTMFVYNTNSQPVWYVASDLLFQNTTGDVQTFTGPLYQTSGPWFGAAFNPNLVTTQQVGTATLAFNGPLSATLTYSVNGVNVTKNIVRQTWRVENIAGNYVGATIGTYSGCASGNGAFESAAVFNITQNGTLATIIESGAGYQCSTTGTYSQAGRMGAIAGTGSCSPSGAARVVAVSEIILTPEGLTARIQGDSGNCRFTGRFGGIRR